MRVPPFPLRPSERDDPIDRWRRYPSHRSDGRAPSGSTSSDAAGDLRDDQG